MPYKTPEQEREAAKLRMQRMRERQRGVTENDVTPLVDVTPFVTPTPVTPLANVTPKIPEEAKRYPAVLHALTDSVRRSKMSSICQSLGNLAKEVRYGVEGPTLDVVSEWLGVTDAPPAAIHSKVSIPESRYEAYKSGSLHDYGR